MKVSPQPSPKPGVVLPRSTISMIAAWAVVVAAGIWLVSFAQVVLIPLIAAIVFHLALLPAVRWFHHHLPVRRGISTFLFILSMLVVAVSLVLICSPAVTAWLGGLAEVVSNPKRWEEVISPGIARRLSTTLGEVLGPLVMGTTSNMVTVCITLVITFFLLVSGEGPMQRISMMARTFGQRRQIVRIFRDLEANTARYILTLSLINFCEFLVVSLALWALGYPKPFAMGLIAGLFNFVPYIGPILAAALIFASTAVDTVDVSSGIFAAGIFLIINLIEGYLISPMVYGSRLRINPIAIIVAVLVGSWLWGIAGALLAMPILVMVRVACDQALCLTPLGLLLTDRPGGYRRRWSRNRTRDMRYRRFRGRRRTRQRGGTVTQDPQASSETNGLNPSASSA